MQSSANSVLYSVTSQNGSITKESPHLTFELNIEEEGWYEAAFNYEEVNIPFKCMVFLDQLYYGELFSASSQELKPSTYDFFLKSGKHTIEIKYLETNATFTGIGITRIQPPVLDTPSFKLSNPDASSQCHKLMDYFKSIYGSKVLTGQHTTYAKGKEIEFISKLTRLTPAIRGFDFMSYSLGTDTKDKTEHCIEELTNNPGSIEKAIEWAKDKKGIVSFCWHWFSPMNGKNKSFYTEDTNFDVEQAVIEGTKEYKAVLADMDVIATQLHILMDKQIPVLWRPLHEADGGWFWWGAKTSQAYIKLYQLMYERFTNYHKLNNLIWVWNAPADGWYPGDNYVDIVSADIYAPNHNYGPLSVSCAHTLSYGHDKPVALGENGPIPDPNHMIRSKTPWLWFLTWGGHFINSEDSNSMEHIQEVYDHAYTITLEDLPDLW